MHDINDIRQVSPTVIGGHARLTYHAPVLAGSHVVRDGMVGAMALATHPVPGMHVGVGIPARAVRPKARPCPSCEQAGRGAAPETPSR